MSAASTAVSVPIDASKALANQRSIDASQYVDWTTAPLGRVSQGRLSGKVAIVTGASSGIGAVTARRLAAEGAKVVLVARRAEKLAAIVSVIKNSGGEAAYLAGDVGSEEVNKQAVELAVQKYGGLHVSVNNAGAGKGIGQAPWEASLATFREQMAVNVDSVFLGVKYQAPAIARSGGGAIINVASNAASFFGLTGISLYAASKTWVVGYTKHAATELSKIGVRINALSPGATYSDALGADGTGHAGTEGFAKFHAIGRPLKTEEIAAAVAFLASDEAQGITGTEMLVDGGMTVGDRTAVGK